MAFLATEVDDRDAPVVVVNPASYRHPGDRRLGCRRLPGGVAVARLRCWFMIVLSPVLVFFGPED